MELEDGGYYMCVANNSVGNSSSSSFQVEVTDESMFNTFVVITTHSFFFLSSVPLPPQNQNL